MEFYGAMGKAVAERTYARKVGDRYETWKDIAKRVAIGNASLCKRADEVVSEASTLESEISSGRLLTSGRHLQHGDITQKMRNLEVVTNCSTAHSTFALTYLLLNGSGVGRCYDDDMMLTDWDNLPNVICVLDDKHADFKYSSHLTPREAVHRYGTNAKYFQVQDSREGWAQAIEYLEVMAWSKIYHDSMVVLDFSRVRPKSDPIAGMQGKPASGPVPLMEAIQKITSLKGAKMPRWKQAMFVDHYIADCVLVGGVRRSARMSVKFWKDSSIFDFINIKRPPEFLGKSPAEIQSLRPKEGFLWTSNNSVLVDAEFWELVKLSPRNKLFKSSLAAHARRVFEEVISAAYADGTGEPGLINVDKLREVELKGEPSFGSRQYKLLEDTNLYLKYLTKAAIKKQYTMIVNPCSEITIAIWGGYCVIADICPFFCKDLYELERTAKATVRFLIRCNTMDSLYDNEVKRTNRIGVGLTGVHEWALKNFGFTFKDLIDEDKSKKFWQLLSYIRQVCEDEADRYSKEMGLERPHTVTTIKPSGTVSKLFGLTEGWHLPSMREYLRWVQFSDEKVVQDYAAKGYPTRRLETYKNTWIVGFPTQPFIETLGQTTMAAEATMEEQFKWIMLGEKYWIGPRGNQISYTLKFKNDLSLDDFKKSILEYQPKIRCCSMMCQEDESAYEYLPEQPITREYYNKLMSGISTASEDIGMEHVDCGTGACPIDFKESK